MAAKNQPIIVIKKKGGHGGHHGGAWKVAYADFVTAMMALFIVLWLMSTSEAVKKAVAGYFNDPKGTGSLLGTTMSGTGAATSAASATGAAAPNDNLEKLQQLKEKLEQEIKARKELEKLTKQIELTITSEGLRIELLEGKDGTFYQSGSARLSADGQELLALLAAELKTLPNALLIEGHTDAAPYSNDVNYGNWELSADRANSARRLLQQDGVRSDQVTQVRGYADQMLRVKSNPTDPSNRRISILVKNADGSLPIVPGTRVVGVPQNPENPKAGEANATPQGSPSATATATPAASTPAPVKGKPSAGTPAAKPGLMDRVKGMLWGKKK
jgi:chemotaxis protein MotB